MTNPVYSLETMRLVIADFEARIAALQPKAPAPTSNPEALLAIAAQAQAAYWDAEAALERALGIEIDMEDLSGWTVEQLKGKYGR